MKRSQVVRFMMSPILALLIVSGAMGKNVQVGTCIPHVPSYSTISLAVSAVAPGTTILVCPGTYPEQITITQPLTLRGVQSGSAANPVITVPSGGLTKSVIAPTNGITMFFQILVQGTESELVNISNIAVDGRSSTNNLLNGWVEGVYYQNSSGTLGKVATYNQTGNGYGFGIFLESTTSSAKTIAITNSSVHDFDAEGIRSNANTTPPSLTVNISSNSVIDSSSLSGKAVYAGINIDGVGQIVGNRVITHPAPPGTSAGVGIAFLSNMIVSGNTVIGWGIWGLGDFNTVKSNMVSLAGGAITISGNSNNVQSNRILNMGGGSGISFNCTGTANTVINNIINDSSLGIIDHAGNTIAPNSYSNVAQTVSPQC